MKKYFALPVALMLMVLLLSGCEDEVETTGSGVGGEWLIPRDRVFDGGPGKDGIPSVDNPQFVKPAEAAFLIDNDLVLVMKSGEEVKAYPHVILDWHEIINDRINGVDLAVTYCPLTGTGIGWDRIINGKVTTFGVSGLLFNTNLIPYDRSTGSNWSQMRLQAVNGSLIGKDVKTIQLLETTWKTFKRMYPQSLVVSTNTGFNRTYETYPYGDYRTNNNQLLFPVDGNDDRLSGKRRVLGVIVGDKSKVYQLGSFPAGVGTFNETVNALDIVVVGSRTMNFAMSFKRQMRDGKILSFTPVQDSLPVVMVDNEGTRWDVFGDAVSGPRAGQKLTPALSFTAFWFAWAAFYPGAEIYSM